MRKVSKTAFLSKKKAFFIYISE